MSGKSGTFTSSRRENIGIKTIEKDHAEELLALFKDEIADLNKKQKDFHIQTFLSPAKVVIQTKTQGDKTVEGVKNKLLSWLETLTHEKVITEIEEDNQKKIRDYLKRKKIFFRESKSHQSQVFRMKFKKSDNGAGDCMARLSEILGRTDQMSAGETKMGNKTIKKSPFSEISKSQPDNTSVKRSVDEKPSMGTVGDLSRQVDDLETKSRSFTKSLKAEKAQERRKVEEREKSDKQVKNSLSLDPLVHLPNDDSFGTSQMSKPLKISYKLDVPLKSGLIFRIYTADITKLNLDAIVNPANEKLLNNGGCALHISKAAGKDFEGDCKRNITEKKTIKVTENVVTSAGDLPCICIINAVGPDWTNYDKGKKVKCLEDLLKTVINILERAEKTQMSSVAIPPISSGIFGVPAEVCAPMYVKAITDFGEKQRRKLREVHLVDLDPSNNILDLTASAYHTSLQKRESLNPNDVMRRFAQQCLPGTKSVNKKDNVEASLNQSRCHFVGNDKGVISFEMDRKLKIFIYKGDIVSLKNIGILVCSENKGVTGSGALAQSILKNAGQLYQKDLKKLKENVSKTEKYLKVGTTCVLHAGKLNYQHVILAIISRFLHERAPQDDELLELQHTVYHVLNHADDIITPVKKKSAAHPNSLAMPLLGAGKMTEPRHLEMLCWSVYFAIDSYMNRSDEVALNEIHLVSFNDNTNEAFINVFMAGSAEKYRQSRPFPPTARPASADLSQHKTSTKDKDNKHVEIWTMESRKNSPPNIKTYFQSPTEKSLDTCVICLEPHTKPVELNLCHHVFCEECIGDFFSRKTACPVCNTVYGKIYGDQPQTGTATIFKEKYSLPGYPKSDTWEILYEFPDGVQLDCHPHPGLPYKGTRRLAFLPATKEGTAVLRMLERAFKQGLIFTVGSSRTTGQSNVVTWNDIHHKTRPNGGPERFGYPDPDYLLRVREELEAKGITERDDREQQ
ncbi:protein mono-ADP-ribosyltransferase PARP14-like [Saccostrea echinata]|uniref:protein mono-ADP-ribosyltransferase PARP14-like n=1 Tax=Saccostrea echinata TaxID=191078 RepID=UPI002A7F6DBB|nr:protein mono-ADP-ribosyltransferase PARP14-like [Saccostrea echinata]